MRTGQRLQELRIGANMTQEQLADMLYVSRESVSKWELGQRKPDIRTLRSIAAIFSVDIEYLLDDREIISELSACIPPDARIDATKIKDILKPFLDTLTERDRSVFIRRYFFLEAPAEIGDLYEIKDNYVRAILARTRKKLKNYMKGALQ